MDVIGSGGTEEKGGSPSPFPLSSSVDLVRGRENDASLVVRGGGNQLSIWRCRSGERRQQKDLTK